MDGKIDQIKESTGVLADEDSLKNDRKPDQVVEKVKAKVERVKGKLAQAVEQMKAALSGQRSHRWGK